MCVHHTDGFADVADGDGLCWRSCFCIVLFCVYSLPLMCVHRAESVVDSDGLSWRSCFCSVLFCLYYPSCVCITQMASLTAMGFPGDRVSFALEATGLSTIRRVCV